jgi:hypothetical protein
MKTQREYQNFNCQKVEAYKRTRLLGGIIVKCCRCLQQWLVIDGLYNGDIYICKSCGCRSSIALED